MHISEKEAYLAKYNETIDAHGTEGPYADTSILYEIRPVVSLEGILLPKIIPKDVRGIPNLEKYTAYIGPKEVRDTFTTVPWLKPYDVLMSHSEEQEYKAVRDTQQARLSLP